jgi:hypothetical protein
MPAVEPDGQYEPAGHVPEQEAVDRPIVLPNVPAGHDVGKPDPAGQYLPTGHVEGEMEPVGQYDPAGQGPEQDEVFNPVVLPNVPAGQNVPAVIAVNAQYKPGGHAVHAPTPETGL